MKFEIEGPFEMYRQKKLVDNSADACRYYWEWVDEHVEGLSGACGCYIFAIQAGRGTLPWYVGKAERQPFSKECMNAHKINHYNTALAGRTGRPVLFFIPQVTNNGIYRGPTIGERPAIQKLESLLMGMAISRNPKLLNMRGVKFLSNVTVRGFINSGPGKATKPARELRKLLNK